MGDLIRTPHSEINAFIESLDALGLTAEDLRTFRKGEISFRRSIVRAIKGNPMLWLGLEFTELAERLGCNALEFQRLVIEEDLVRGIREVLLRRAEIRAIEHLIDCDADPFNPWAKDGWTVDEHQKGGQWKFDPKGVEFFLSNSQKGGKVIEGNKLRKELAKKPVFNANVLDYLYANPHLIPEEWKKDEQGNTRYIFFWGTVYRDRVGNLYVRCLCWDDVRWFWGRRWLGYDWNASNPAALRAS